MEGSTRFTLNSTDLKKIGIGFLIALSGTALSFVADTLQVMDFGDLQPVAVILLPVVMALINAGRIWFKDNSIQ
jgi:hypothetical protein